MKLEVRSAPPSSGYIGQYYKRRPPRKKRPSLICPAMFVVIAAGYLVGSVALRPVMEAWLQKA